MQENVLFSLSNTVPFNGQSFQKQKGSGLVTSRSSGHKASSENYFICYILSDQVWWCNLKQLLSYSKNYICKFMHVISWHHKLFHFYLSCCIWKVWKGREKIPKIGISWERKDKIRKAFSIVFKRLSFGEKIKIW